MTSSLLTTDQKAALKELTDKLNRHGISFIVIGGLAAIAWGVKRPLADIDIQVSKAEFRKVERLFAYEVTVKSRHYVTEKWDIRQMIVRLSNVDIDICQAEDFYIKNGNEKYLLQNSIQTASIAEVGGVSIPVMPLDKLIAYKKIIARPIDINDLDFLLKLQ